MSGKVYTENIKTMTLILRATNTDYDLVSVISIQASCGGEPTNLTSIKNLNNKIHFEITFVVTRCNSLTSDDF